MRQFSHDRRAQRPAAALQQLRHRRARAAPGAHRRRGRCAGAAGRRAAGATRPSSCSAAAATSCSPATSSRWCSRSRSWAGGWWRRPPRAWIVEAGAGENWHDTVRWTLEQRLSRAGEPGDDSRHGGRLAGAEHRRLRGRAAGPLRLARRHRPGHRPHLHARRGAVRLRLPRFGVQARGQPAPTTSAWPAGR